ncbi:MAG: O-methyltransferase [Cytophagaceae bacterium]
MSKLGILGRYISFLAKSGNEHSIHSPFVYNLYVKVIKSEYLVEDFDQIENLRKELLQSSKKVKITDLGAGSRINNNTTRSIADIARNSEKSKSLARLLYRLANHTRPKIIVDLGTSLGITTIYLSKACPESKIYTFEGCPETAKIANQNFLNLNCSNISLVKGNIDQTLPEFVHKSTTLDFVFFDANHRFEPTMRYFKECLIKATEESVFVFDDIYWSKEMAKAWEEIKAHPEVSLTIDLFYIGLVFFRKKQPKQHFKLRI